jgi:phosphoribosylamine--glycine ligase
MEKIFIPTIEAMNKEGRSFSGCLYFGLMLTKDGPKVIEYNCRFGDPETQVVLPLLESDLFTVMKAVSKGELSNADVRFSDGACCCVVMASDGYPEKYNSGYEITLPAQYEEYEDVFVAGAKLSDGKLLSAGGRVLGASAKADDLKTAIARAYALTEKISFENAYKRDDIGARALSVFEKE